MSQAFQRRGNPVDSGQEIIGTPAGLRDTWIRSIVLRMRIIGVGMDACPYRGLMRLCLFTH